MFGSVLVCLHAAAMLYRFGVAPPIPVSGDEIAVNDAAVALSRGQGLIAPSFSESIAGIDKLYAHFPPVYIFLQAAVFRAFGISGYSLRLITTIFSIAAAITFLTIVHQLWDRGLVKDTRAILVSCLYVLSAPVLILHRIGRMESLVEFLSLVNLYCVLKIILGCEDRTVSRSRQSQIWLLVVAAISAALALASHPEAINAILPGILIVAFAERVRLLDKIGFAALLAFAPSMIWIGTYRSSWSLALAQMAMIAREKAPDPSMAGFGLALAERATDSAHDAMVFFFFSLTLLVLAGALGQVIHAAVLRRGGASIANESIRPIEKSLTLAVPLTLIILIFFLPASITRLEALYPVYLLLIGVLVVPYVNRAVTRPFLKLLVGALVGCQFLASIVYLGHNRTLSKEPAPRYEAVLKCIPPTAKIAASPQLWFVFQINNRQFSVLYPGLDGFESWAKASSRPLDRFDVILLTDYSRDDRYAPLSATGKIEQDVTVGSRVIRIYSRSPIVANCEKNI